MRMSYTHECCGHRTISDLDDIDTKTGYVLIDTGYSYSRPRPLRDCLAGVAAYSWIQGEGQYKYARKLASEFKKLGYEIIKVDLGHNPGHSKSYTLKMWIAKRTDKSVA